MKKCLFTIVVTICSVIPTVLQANTVTKTFTGSIVNGARMGAIATGSFSYDDALIINGDEILSPGNLVQVGLTVTFAFDGQNFNESHDIDFPNFPVLVFNAFEPVFLDYILEQGTNGVNFTDSNLLGLDLLSLTPVVGPGTFDFNADIIATYVPIPGALWLLFSGLTGLVYFRRTNGSGHQ